MPRYSERTGELQEYQVGPFDSTHLYVQWGGALPGEEQWSCGLRMWRGGGSLPADAVAAIGVIANQVRLYHVNPLAGIHSRARLQFVKVNAIGVNGRYQVQTTTEETFTDKPGGGSGESGQFGTIHPNQVAQVVSLVTGFSRGPAHRGRFYNPLPVAGMDIDGRVSAQFCRDTATAAQAFIDGLNQGPADDHKVVVMSRKAGAPAHRLVTGVEVGRVLDTQRRRRRSLLEDVQRPTLAP